MCFYTANIYIIFEIIYLSPKKAFSKSYYHLLPTFTTYYWRAVLAILLGIYVKKYQK